MSLGQFWIHIESYIIIFMCIYIYDTNIGSGLVLCGRVLITDEILDDVGDNLYDILGCFP